MISLLVKEYKTNKNQLVFVRFFTVYHDKPTSHPLYDVYRKISENVDICHYIDMHSEKQLNNLPLYIIDKSKHIDRALLEFKQEMKMTYYDYFKRWPRKNEKRIIGKN